MSFYEALKGNTMFTNLNKKELDELFAHPSFFKKTYKKNECIIHYNEAVQSIGFLIKGSVRIEEVDIWGESHLLQQLKQGELFGESFYFSNVSNYPVEISAIENSEVIFLDYNQLVKTCNEHVKMILMEAMLSVLSNKNLHLRQKIELVSKHKIRDKVLGYLSGESTRANSKSFDISLDRNELAAYLACDRSALSKELSKMEEEGILTYKKNHFELKK